jgi:solute:Na+ symporter, SSS family
MPGIYLIITCMIVFLVINMIIIFRLHKHPDSFEAYSVGNRSFGFILYTFTYAGYWYVGSVYISWFSTAARVGVFAQYLLIYSIASLVIFYFMAKPVWTWGKIYQLETQADIIELRYKNTLFKHAFSIMTFFFWFPWIILEMKTIGYTISVTTGNVIDYNLGMVIVCLYVIIYTFYGGARGSSIGSAVQAICFAGIGIIIIGFLIWRTYGSIFSLFDIVEKQNPELLVLQEGYKGLYWSSVVITSTLGAFCLPGVFRLFYLAESYRTIRKTACFAPIIVIPNFLLLLLLALGGTTLPGFPDISEVSLFWIAKTYGGNLILGLVAVVALAASMSTVSAVINSSAVIISKDWIGGIFGRSSREEMLKYAKGATIAAGILSLYIASIDIPNLLFIALLMYDFIVQAFVPLFVGLYWKKSNLIGASAGMIAGIIIAMLGNIVPASILWAGGWSAGMIGLMVNLMIHIFCGLVWGKQEHVEDLFCSLESKNHDL